MTRDMLGRTAVAVAFLTALAVVLGLAPASQPPADRAAQVDSPG